MHTLLFAPLARYSTGRKSTRECAFEVDLDQVPMTPKREADGRWWIDLPMQGALTVRVVPTNPSFWPLVAYYRVRDGVLEPDSVPAEFEPPRSVIAPNGDRVTTLRVHLSRLRDETAECETALERVPPERRNDLAQEILETEYQDAWPPVKWETPSTLVRFLDTEQPIEAGRARIFDSESLALDNENLVLRLKNVVAPELLAVSWPKRIAPSDASGATQFLVYFHPNHGQNRQYYPVATYPLGFEHVFWGMWKYLNFVGDPLLVNCTAKGIPFQVEAAERDVVTVIPCNKVGPEVGVLLKAETMDLVLEEVQDFFFRRAGVYASIPEISRVALAGFSASTTLVTSFLNNAENQNDDFFLDTLKEVYFFDPGYKVERSIGCVNAAKRWASRGALEDKMIRIYEHRRVSEVARLLGIDATAGSHVTTSADGLRSVGYLPYSLWFNAAETAGDVRQVTARGDWSTFQITHQMIPAFLLTHALAKSGF